MVDSDNIKYSFNYIHSVDRVTYRISFKNYLSSITIMTTLCFRQLSSYDRIKDKVISCYCTLDLKCYLGFYILRMEKGTEGIPC